MWRLQRGTWTDREAVIACRSKQVILILFMAIKTWWRSRIYWLPWKIMLVHDISCPSNRFFQPRFWPLDWESSALTTRPLLAMNKSFACIVHNEQKLLIATITEKTRVYLFNGRLIDFSFKFMLLVSKKEVICHDYDNPETVN